MGIKMTSRIIGTGSCLPETVVSNDFLAGIMDTSDEWIGSRTGIRERHLAKEETTASMCAAAGKRAMENAGIRPEELELIIVGTVTADHVTPSAACEVQAALGAVNAAAFDINAACSGFLYALHTAHAYICAGFCRTALVLGAETLSRIMDWNDRSTCVLFGDGAGAAVVRADEKGLISFEQYSDGSRGGVLACRARANNNPLVTNPTALDYVHMDGQEVYKFAVGTVPKSIGRVLEKAQLAPEAVDHYLLHQANVRILQSVAKRLKVPEERFLINLEHCGNLSAGSIPVLLDEKNRAGLLKRGDKLILCGFGGGLTWGTALLEW